MYIGLRVAGSSDRTCATRYVFYAAQADEFHADARTEIDSDVLPAHQQKKTRSRISAAPCSKKFLIQ